MPAASATALARAAAAGPCAGLAGAEERLARPVDDVHLDGGRHRGETQDRIGAPVEAGAMRVASKVTARRAVQLSDWMIAALDLVADAVRIDGLAAVDRGDHARQIRRAGVAIDARPPSPPRNRRRGSCSGQRRSRSRGRAAFVAPPSRTVGGRSARPRRARASRRWREPESDRIGAAAARQLVHEALDREHVHVARRASAAPRRAPASRARSEMHARVRAARRADGVTVAAALRQRDRPAAAAAGTAGSSSAPASRPPAVAGRGAVRVAPDVVVPAGDAAVARRARAAHLDDHRRAEGSQPCSCSRIHCTRTGRPGTARASSAASAATSSAPLWP